MAVPTSAYFKITLFSIFFLLIMLFLVDHEMTFKAIKGKADLGWKKYYLNNP